jgi:hypothetical protein
MTNRKAFIRALAEYLGGQNQMHMSVQLEMVSRGTCGELTKISAGMWDKIRRTTPLFGYPTVEETERALTDWLFGEDVELKEK